MKNQVQTKKQTNKISAKLQKELIYYNTANVNEAVSMIKQDIINLTPEDRKSYKKHILNSLNSSYYDKMFLEDLSNHSVSYCFTLSQVRNILYVYLEEIKEIIYIPSFKCFKITKNK